MNNQTLLCFDYGKKRIGAAVGQTVTGTATALETIMITGGKPDWDNIEYLIERWNPNKLIVGQPLTLEGDRQEMTEAAEKFTRQLQNRFNISVEMIEEQLSSYEARRELKSTRNLDPVAARLILETWLNENSSNNNHKLTDNQEH
ncbi:MAG: Holliday junction resolvase RuvX [Proteobacteria bacterium]|nr:Holliday junction resolvase RuvX [Pseudomonadota bacterium]